MATKWYQKATVQGALVAAAGLIIITLIPIALQVPKLQEANHTLERSIGEKNVQLQRLETQLAPFKTIALERYTGPENEALAKLAGQVQLLQRLDEEKTAKIQTLERSLEKTSAQASPPVLSLASSSISDKDGAKVATLRFNSSKNVPLGAIVFVAEVSTFSLTPPPKIVDFWPDANSAFVSGNDSKKIAEDGLSARLVYSLVGAGAPVVDLTVSSEATVTVTGNYIEKPIQIDIK